jgi:hypothetical protein
MAPKEDGAQSHAAACQTPAGPALPYGSMDGGAWMVSVERGAWSLELGRRRRAALGEYGRQQCAVRSAQCSATRPWARQGQPGPVKGSGWVEEQAAWSCWIARPEDNDSRRESR